MSRREAWYSIDMEAAEAAGQVVSTLEAYNVMPMDSLNYIGLDFIPEILQSSIQSFYDGVMTAEQVAQELQNKISLYLME